jgi:hypothetical protein
MKIWMSEEDGETRIRTKFGAISAFVPLKLWDTNWWWWGLERERMTGAR